MRGSQRLGLEPYTAIQTLDLPASFTKTCPERQSTYETLFKYPSLPFYLWPPKRPSSSGPERRPRLHLASEHPHGWQELNAHHHDERTQTRPRCEQHALWAPCVRLRPQHAGLRGPGAGRRRVPGDGGQRVRRPALRLAVQARNLPRPLRCGLLHERRRPGPRARRRAHRGRRQRSRLLDAPSQCYVQLLALLREPVHRGYRAHEPDNDHRCLAGGCLPFHPYSLLASGFHSPRDRQHL